MCRGAPSGISGDSSSSGGGLTHSMQMPPQPSMMPASRMALLPLLPSRFLKIQPKVRVWMSIGTTIIMLRMPR